MRRPATALLLLLARGATTLRPCAPARVRTTRGPAWLAMAAYGEPTTLDADDTPQPAVASARARAAMARESAAPAIGATYRSADFMPLIGGFLALKLDITGRTTARLQLSGALSLTDTISYRVDPYGRLLFSLGPRARRLLRALDVSVVDAVYSRPTDSAHITIKLPALPARRVYLTRVGGPRRQPDGAAAPARAPAARGAARPVARRALDVRAALAPSIEAVAVAILAAADATDGRARADEAADADAARGPATGGGDGGSSVGNGLGGLGRELASSIGASAEDALADVRAVASGVDAMRRELFLKLGAFGAADRAVTESLDAEADREHSVQAEVDNSTRAARAHGGIAAYGAAPAPAPTARAAPSPPPPSAGSRAGVRAAGAPSAGAPARAGLPPVGAVYARSLTLPVIGMQTVRLAIEGERCARLVLTGALSLDEPLEYGIDRHSGAFTFELGAGTLRLLRGMGVSLTAADYTPAGDTASVTIKPPAIGPIRIELSRAS
ncbi:hypothetical protein KFE25_002614 [Diacronema lutheri]|uniref:Uncharacterized protein n=1 Tax=Diacronema lutheri TaxID=2081491 RepID=A0A8J6C8D6_DIALT|nr:hypothetical protein KFE25_002614 [Diacronema lutheri]